MSLWALASCGNATEEFSQQFEMLQDVGASDAELCAMATKLAAVALEDEDLTGYRTWRSERDKVCAGAKEKEVDAFGFVTGNLSYPSDYIPEDLKVCWRNLGTEESECESPISDTTFRLRLKPGEYQVWARRDSETDQRGFYSAAVKCGLSVDCLSHEPLPVTVTAGKTTSGIDPGDWYGP